ncbi:MAG: RAD52 family DNA repair protein [Dehalococcoidia bacterium]|nr:RAD52 family DNA repair protein [Dehalococcoidia bacterium]
MLNGTRRNGSVNGASKNGTNGAHAGAAIGGDHDLLGWDALPPAVTTELARPLDPALVSQRRGRGGKTFSYIEGHVAISEANRIFGFGGWAYELAGDVTLREIETVDRATGEVTRILAYSAPVRVTVPGAPPRTDIGFHAVTDETPDGHETAIKGCVTDGMKRALRSFGDRFGNSLYGEHPAPVRSGSADSLAPALRATLVRLGVMQGFDEEQVRAAVRAKTGRDLDEVTAAELTPLVEGASEKLGQDNDPGDAS